MVTQLQQTQVYQHLMPQPTKLRLNPTLATALVTSTNASNTSHS